MNSNVVLHVFVGLVSFLVGATAVFVSWYFYGLEYEAVLIGTAVALALYSTTTFIYWLTAELLGLPRWSWRDMEGGRGWVALIEWLLR